MVYGWCVQRGFHNEANISVVFILLRVARNGNVNFSFFIKLLCYPCGCADNLKVPQWQAGHVVQH